MTAYSADNVGCCGWMTARKRQGIKSPTEHRYFSIIRFWILDFFIPPPGISADIIK